jgi:hypothetical protein
VAERLHRTAEYPSTGAECEPTALDNIPVSVQIKYYRMSNRRKDNAVPVHGRLIYVNGVATAQGWVEHESATGR